MTDFNHIPARHDAINLRLEEWARYVRVKPQAWPVSPMFRMYQSKARQWETDPVTWLEINTIAAHEIERAVSILPDKHRTAVRWSYVWPWVPVNKVRQELGVTRDGLSELIDQGRDMLKNRLREKIVDNSQ